MRTIGLIGSGLIGAAVARLAVDAGLHVVLSNSRGPETLADIVTELGDAARAATPAEAAQAADLVVVSLPFHAHDKLPADALAGKTVIDTMRYFPDRDGRLDALEQRRTTSSELLQRHLPESHVVKTLSTMDNLRLYSSARPSGHPDRGALPVTGNDAKAKAEVVRFMDALGYDALDVGSLADIWRHEAGTPINVLPYVGEPPRGMSQEQAHEWIFNGPSAVVSTARVKDLMDQATRTGRVGLYLEDLFPVGK
ncbi:NAD(P)-binding domain-containing protein [Streptomyces sp. 4503]|uniref:NAD(P)-binding domain-containing protein n=1 Tax=Streptomyces niphimycinicus TaxID=2842201 RepID=A0ABS6CEM6_9ACTN|nr:NAD(P)-binding domain-containing protein [Streptomyces niphimycinicus]MBU3865337.1 NAD(P)-binding domain-containing protein [Streptomyces niphimycinicus]